MNVRVKVFLFATELDSIVTLRRKSNYNDLKRGNCWTENRSILSSVSIHPTRVNRPLCICVVSIVFGSFPNEFKRSLTGQLYYNYVVRTCRFQYIRWFRDFAFYWRLRLHDPGRPKRFKPPSSGHGIVVKNEMISCNPISTTKFAQQ